MTHSSRLFIVLAFCSTISLMGVGHERNLEEVIKNVKEAAPAVIDWSFEQTNKYPQVPGIFVASILRMAQKSITQKSTGFFFWAVAGSTVIAHGFKITAEKYLQAKASDEKVPNLVGAAINAKEALLEKAKAGIEAAKAIESEAKK